MEIDDRIIKLIFGKTPNSLFGRVLLFAVAPELSEEDFAIFLSAVPDDNALYQAFKARKAREEGKMQYGYSEFAAEILFIEKNKAAWQKAAEVIIAKFGFVGEELRVFNQLSALYFDMSERGDKEFTEIIEALPENSRLVTAISEFGAGFFPEEDI